MNALTPKDISTWKTFRAIARGWLEVNDPERTEEIRKDARRLVESGLAWRVWGFDDVETDAIVAALAELGVETSEAALAAAAAELPGPYELAASWLAGLAGGHGGAELRLHLAARALWARWLPDTPTIETVADRTEAFAAAWFAADRKGEPFDAFPGLERLAGDVEMDEDIADAVAAELPFRLWAFVFRALRGVRGATDLGAWEAVARKLAPALGVPGMMEAELALLFAHNGAPERAIAEADAAVELSASMMVVSRSAEAIAAAGDLDTALALLADATCAAKVDDDVEEGLAVLTEILERAGRADEIPAYLQEVTAARRLRQIEDRKHRRRKEKSKRKRR
jgi:hypothetical protein